MTCVFIGDSIAAGTAHYRPECQNLAVVGRTTAQTLASIHTVPVNAQQVIVSVGSNDTADTHSLESFKNQLLQLRSQLRNQCVTWLLPPHNDIVRRVISQVAGEYRDQLIDVRPWVGAHQVHPRTEGYQRLAQKTQYSQCCSFNNTGEKTP
jgi:lysophospholipase L1-like esterase